jgi:coenzyme F420-reducing hydrogenase delta subunit
MGVGPPGRTGRDQLRELAAELIPRLAAGGPAVVAVCCAQAPGGHVAALRARGAVIHPVSCAGNLHTSAIELLLREGATGVAVCACPPRDCTGREGPKWLMQRLWHEREAELQARVDRRRIRVVTLTPGNRSEALAEFDGFARVVAALAAPERDGAGALVAECEPAAGAEVVR